MKFDKSDGYRSIEELEFELLKEIKINNKEKHLEKFEKFKAKGFSSMYDFYVVSKSGVDYSILMCGNLWEKVRYLKGIGLEEGRLVGINGTNIIYFVDDLLEIDGKYSGGIRLEDIEPQINKANYLKECKRREELIIVNEELRKKAKEEDIKKKIEEKVKWETTGEFESNGLKVFGKTLQKLHMPFNSNQKTVSFQIDYKKKVSSIYELYELRGSYDWYIEKIIANMSKNDIKEMKITKDGSVLNIKADDKGTFLNGIRVQKNNLMKIIRNVKFDEMNEKKIKLMNSLGVMKSGFLKNEEMVVKVINIPIEIDCIDKDNFKLTIGEKKEVIEWNKLVNYFKLGIGSQIATIGVNNFMEMMKIDFKMNKEEIFKMLRTYKMMGAI